jgi:hypothetical protein
MVSALAIAATLTAVLALAPFASAASHPLASGATTITFGKGVVAKLAKNGVKLLGLSPGAMNGTAIVLPIDSGALDPTTGQGSFEHGGGFKFKRGKKTASITSLVLDTSSHSLSGKVAGKPMKFASVEDLTSTRNGFGANLSLPKLKLTGAAATQLNKKLSIRLKAKGKKKSKRAGAGKKPPTGIFKGGQVIGGASSVTQPASLGLVAGGRATLFPGEKTEPFLTAELFPHPIAPASEPEELPPPLFFPIGSGTIALDATAGTIQLEGGVQFVHKPEPEVEVGVTFSSITIDLAAKTMMADISVDSTDQEKAPTPGKLGRKLMARLDPSQVKITPDPAAHKVTFENIESSIPAELASVLNFASSSEVFNEGVSIGTFSAVFQTE